MNYYLVNTKKDFHCFATMVSFQEEKQLKDKVDFYLTGLETCLLPSGYYDKCYRLKSKNKHYYSEYYDFRITCPKCQQKLNLICCGNGDDTIAFFGCKNCKNIHTRRIK